MGDRLTYGAYIQWIAYHKMEDEKFQKWEWYAAQIPLVIAQTNGNKGMSLRDFCIQEKAPKKVSHQEMFKMLAAMAVATGGKVEELDGNSREPIRIS